MIQDSATKLNIPGSIKKPKEPIHISPPVKEAKSKTTQKNIA